MPRRRTLEEFISISNQIHNYEYDYSQIKEYSNNKAYYSITCPKHGEFLQRADHHMSGKKCVNCGYQTVANKQTYSFEELKTKFAIIHENKYSYKSNTGFTKCIDKIEIVCPIHGIYLQKAVIHLRGAGCKICYDSKGEKQITTELNNHNIDYNREHKFNDCKDKKALPFDFYIPSLNLCIEYDGLQHFKPIKRYGGASYFETIKKHDKIKNEYCSKNGISLLRIRYDQNVENVVNNYLFSGSSIC